ncbi:MAG: LysR family transcriptional regulator [Rhodospirillaceae bacterium]
MASPQDLRLLSHFVAIARTGSIRGAARRLSLSAPVLSEALSDLEARVGQTLIQRTTRSMTLTPAGQEMLELAATAVSAADQALALGEDSGTTPSGVVRITLPAELCVSWLPPVLRRFQADCPDVEVRVVAEDAQIDLATSAIDIAIRSRFALKPPPPRDGQFHIPLELVAHPDLLDAKQGETLAECVARIGVIGRIGSGESPTLDALDQAGTAHQIPVGSSFKVNSQLVALHLALEGFGAALLSSLAVKTPVSQRRLARIDPTMGFGQLICQPISRDRYPSRPARALLPYLTNP